MKPRDLVEDWNGFENFVAKLHEDGEVEVLHNQTLTGQSGATRQIDVLLRHNKGPYSYLTLIECKYWKEKVKREQIDVLYASMLDLNASKGVFFTTSGFQRGAQKYAESKGITLYKVRELTDPEWGLPGKVISFYLQIIQPGIRNVSPRIIGISKKDGSDFTEGVSFSLNFGEEKDKGCVILSKHNRLFKTVESMIEHHISETIKAITQKSFLINNGENCTRYLQKPLILDFPEHLVAESDEVIFLIDKISINIGIKVDQSSINIDRSESYKYAIAVYDCATKRSYSVAEKKNETYSEWKVLSDPSEKTTTDVMTNGSILSVTIAGYFAAEEMQGLQEYKLSLD